MACPQQASLFAPAPLTLADDAEGGVRYWPPQFGAAQQQALFQALLQTLDWRAQQRLMYERQVAVPRLVASLPLAQALQLPALRAVHAAVAALVPAPFTHVGCNLYRNGQDSVALHGDRLPELCAGQPIVLVSLGATRDFVLRARQPGARLLRIAMEPASVLAMSHASQSTHVHGVPKSAQAVGARISCVFRVRSAAAHWPGW